MRSLGRAASSLSAARSRVSRAVTFIGVPPNTNVVAKTSDNRIVSELVRGMTKIRGTGMFIVMTCYCFLCGYLVLCTEGPREDQIEKHIRSVFEKCKSDGDLILETASKMNITETELDALADIGYDLRICDKLVWFDTVETTTGSNYFNRWDILSATSFVATTISTIGYGNLTPKTWEGKLVTVFIAITGIPMAGIFFSKTAKGVSTAILWWSHLLHKRFFRKKEQKHLHPQRIKRQSTAIDVVARLSEVDLFIILLGLSLSFIAVSAELTNVSMKGKWGYSNSFWFVFVTFTTIGYGDFVPFWYDEELKSPSENPFMLLFVPIVTFLVIVVGLSFFVSLVQSATKIFEKKMEKLEKSISGGGMSNIEEEGEVDSDDDGSYSDTEGGVEMGRKDSFFANQNPIQQARDASDD